ncbi:MAG: potassium/proton antiporter [Oscillospiraceae bacterium]|nr:potassium/proton antiporter [Oscillospiraceae bacterium]
MLLELIAVAFIILCCIFGSKISLKFGLPTLLLFILLGMAFGSDGIFKIEFDNYMFAQNISSAALILIIFYGGFGTKWTKARKAAGRSILLSSVGTILTALLVGLFCTFVLKFEPTEGFLIGAVISSTDAASVFAILRSKKLNLKYRSAPILELESGSNDPFAYMLTIIILSIMQGDGNAGDFAIMFAKQLGFGLLFGGAFAYLGVLALKHIKFEESGFDAIFVCAMAIISYAIPAFFGGNGYLAAYITGIAMGNTDVPGKKALVNFFDGLTGITQIMLFFMLGLICFPSQMAHTILPAALIAVFLTLVARPLAVFLIMKPFKAHLNQIALVSFAGIRGASSIVFAIMVTANEAYTKNDIFHIVFMIVLISISVQGSLLPLVARKTNMIDDGENVMKTFNDYSDENAVQFIRLKVYENGTWAGSMIKDIEIPQGLLIALIKRDGKSLIPYGGTTLLAGDEIVLSGVGFSDDKSRIFHEITIESDRNGKRIAELDLPRGDLIILIKRDGDVLVPNGQIELKEDDVLVMASSPRTVVNN